MNIMLMTTRMIWPNLPPKSNPILISEKVKVLIYQGKAVFVIKVCSTGERVRGIPALMMLKMSCIATCSLPDWKQTTVDKGWNTMFMLNLLYSKNSASLQRIGKFVRVYIGQWYIPYIHRSWSLTNIHVHHELWCPGQSITLNPSPPFKHCSGI